MVGSSSSVTCESNQDVKLAASQDQEQSLAGRRFFLVAVFMSNPRLLLEAAIQGRGGPSRHQVVGRRGAFFGDEVEQTGAFEASLPPIPGDFHESGIPQTAILPNSVFGQYGQRV